MIKAQDVKEGMRLNYPYPWNDYVCDVQLVSDNQVKIITGMNGTGSRFYDMDEMVPVIFESDWR